MYYDVINGYNRQSFLSFPIEDLAVVAQNKICLQDPSRNWDIFVVEYDDDGFAKRVRHAEGGGWWESPKRPFKRWLSKSFREYLNSGKECDEEYMLSVVEEYWKAIGWQAKLDETWKYPKHPRI